MPFVKLDCGMVDSTIWIDREAREIFITALLMASPHEFSEALPQLKVDVIEPTGYTVPPGWYGFVAAAGPGIVRRASVPLDAGIEALKRLGNPDPASRSQEFDGRRMIRIDGGYLILNFMKYRDRDYGAAERMRKLRARKRGDVTPERDACSPEQLHIAESRVQSPEADSRKDIRDAKASALRVLEFLNTKAKRAYKPVSANIDFILARLKEGATEQDMKSVIARKIRDWGTDPKMSQYLRPATLFNKTKFAQYQGELVETEGE